ncbi:MAG: phage terminase small subunit P27 family [Bradyrhizobium sp.]|nr:phage terminase small subunit P27 family [Bradyrhizobium sp.]
MNPPKPTAIRKLQGNPGHRGYNATEPQPPKGRPQCPSWLPAAAKTEFRRLAKHLDGMGVLSRAEPMLAPLAVALARWREAEAIVTEDGILDAKGNLRGAVRASELYFKQALRIVTEYGLTPSSRSRIHVIEAAGVTDPVDEFLFGGLAAIDESPPVEIGSN